LGLYNDNETTTSGDLKSRDYWRARFNAEMLEQALTTRQPEGRIGFELIGAISVLDDLLKVWPNHSSLQQWHERASAVRKQVDPNADRQAPFTGRCMWNEHSYQEAFVGYHSGKLFAAELEYGEAFESFRTASQKLDVLTRRLDENDHVDGWPAEIVAWIRQVKPEVEQLREETSKKR
jgi:hypothetical protein